MLKTIIAISLFSFTFLGCHKTEAPVLQSRSAAVTSTPIEFTVEFKGLMVFRQDPGRTGYEVGILAANDHEFKVQYPGDSTAGKPLPKGVHWTLEITNSPSNPAVISPREKGHSGRRPDSQFGQNDFSWIIDLEGKEFHDKQLNLEAGHLKPIIQLPNGELFTEFKSLDLQRRRGETGQFSNFGFVPEAIALRLELQPGQELVLKDVSSGEKVFTLPYGSPFPSHTVYINNTRPVPTEASDFEMYYELFPDIPKDERFDFQANKGADKMRPLNPDPTYTMRTCCQMACTAIFLSQTKALK